MKILIVGGGLQGLSCGCSLYKNHEVSIVADDLMCRRSRFFKNVYPNVKADESLFALLQKVQFDVIIPISDFTVPFISKNKSEIEKRFDVKCAVPDYDRVSQVEDKSRFMAFCEANNVPHPQTCVLNGDTLEQAAIKVGFPALIKPDYSVGARGITRVDSLGELEEKFSGINEKFGTCTLQELIENQEYYYNVMLYRDKNGKIVSNAIIKIVRMYPIAAGSSSCCISVENDDLIRICSDCLDKLGWEGFADFDVLQRLDNEEYKIIEINPRVPASLKGAAISGVNFPEIIVNVVKGMDIPKQIYMAGKTMRYLGIDIMWFMKSPKRIAVRPSWFSFLGRSIYYQDIYKEDFSTWWTWLAEGLLKLSKRNKRLR